MLRTLNNARKRQSRTLANSKEENANIVKECGNKRTSFLVTHEVTRSAFLSDL